ncbi:unnamed protein product [Pleuronectes platessa]|uniref:Uncharacterized protein n=1 Tax=Pleuronectes platessa TaxID=8262 RepID=A0A9N7YGQ1_PLEPL|nr:unnamed protein product [Pleuronectes platessa]
MTAPSEDMRRQVLGSEVKKLKEEVCQISRSVKAASGPWVLLRQSSHITVRSSVHTDPGFYGSSEWSSSVRELQRMSTEPGPYFLRRSPFTHARHSRRSSYQTGLQQHRTPSESLKYVSQIQHVRRLSRIEFMSESNLRGAAWTCCTTDVLEI